MKTQRELDLLVDIVKLLKKYGPETFDSLAELISSPGMTQQLPHILTQVEKIARTTPKTKRKTGKKRGPSIPRSLTNLESIDPEKYQLLMKFYTDLITKRVLSSLRDIKEFAIECELSEIRAKSREKTISPLISSLIKLPNEQLKVKIQLLKKYDTGDRSLEGWSNIILNRKRGLDETQ